ncbi:hypothetical protein LCGC14_0544440 [marine sediment metagenome]|uniref:Uncharacterized protein n=1 Tax=marine sediment metagenome TaxID=412755 RepID=A0A0F9SA88_9ZZZZ
MKKFVSFVSDLRTIIVSCLAIIVFLGYLSGFLKLPKQVELLAKTTGELKENDMEQTIAISSLADNLDDYIEVQKMLYKEREKYEMERERKQDRQIDLLTEIAINDR